MVKAAKKEIPTLGNWPNENEDFIAAPELESLAGRLGENCEEIQWRLKARIYFQFQREMSGDTVGNCTRTPKRFRGVLPYDFVVTIDWEHWRFLDGDQKEQLLYHELKHIGKNEDLEWCSAKHEFEGFVTEWMRYGEVIRRDKELGKIFDVQLELLPGGSAK